MTLKVKQHLPIYRQKRLALCGAPMPVMVRACGERIEGARYHCTDRYCDSCARARAQRAYACIMRNLNKTSALLGLESARMVTLTVQAPATGLGGPALRDAIARFASVQSATHARLRRHDYAIERHAYHSHNGKLQLADKWAAEARRALPRFDADAVYDRPGRSADYTHDIVGYRPASLGRTTYIWAREITSNENAGWWHVHAHYLVPSESDAHRLVAAHLAAARELGVYVQTQGQRISTPQASEWRDDESAVERAASYVTHYVTKTDIGASAAYLGAYIHGTHGLRQYDAAGCWRPLGIGQRRADDVAPVTRIEWPEYVVGPLGELGVEIKTESFQTMMKGGGRYLEAIRESTLNQYRTNLTKCDLVTILGREAVVTRLDAGNIGLIPPKTRQKMIEFVQK